MLHTTITTVDHNIWQLTEWR